MGIFLLLTRKATPREKLLRLPEIPAKYNVQKNIESEESQINPFRMPSDSGVFAMREEDKRLKLEV
jgi:hypothetical protein